MGIAMASDARFRTGHHHPLADPNAHADCAGWNHAGTAFLSVQWTSHPPTALEGVDQTSCDSTMPLLCCA
jgi:hypothetical protein